MKKLILSAVAVMCGSFLVMAADREQMNITKLYIGGTEVTATAAELNLVDGASKVGAVTGVTGTNKLATATATVTKQVNAFVTAVTIQTATATNDFGGAAVVTNIVLTTVNALTNVTVAITPDVATNAVVGIGVTTNTFLKN